MIKKIFVLSAVLVLGGAVLFGTSAWRHLQHGVHKARQTLDASIPIEFQLERAETMIEELIPEIEASKRVVAEEQVEIRYLGQEIARLEAHQEEEAQRIRTQTAALKAMPSAFPVAGRDYSRASVENDIRLALKRHQSTAALLESKRRLLEARRRSLEAANRKLETTVAEKENLAINVEDLRARLREAQALNATHCRLDLDGGKLAEVQKILARCRKRLDVAQQLLENEHATIGELPDLQAPPESVVVEVERYFGVPAVLRPAADALVR
jgi:chromosome segregation ATPase